MGKDTTAFRERFNAYKNGKSVSEIYDAGLPRYAGGTPTNTSWHSQAADLLDKFEGFRDSVYLDGKGIPTIGYGFTDPSLIKRGRISKPEARKILNGEISVRGNRLRSILGAERFDKLADSTKAALLSYYYNYPAGFADTTKLMKAWRNNDYREFVRLIDAGMNDAANPGLRDRRIEEQGLVLEDPFLFPKQVEEKSFVNTTAAKFNEENQFKPWSNYHQADYSLNNPAPPAISSWNNPNSPSYTPAGLKARRVDFGKMMMGILEDDELEFPPIQTVKTVASPDSKIATFTGFKNGKLPRFRGGKGDGTRYLWDEDKKEWDRITNDEYARAFADLTIVPKNKGGNRLDIRTNPIDHYPKLKNAGYVTDLMLEDEINSIKLHETAAYAPGLEQVSPEFDLLMLGNPFRFNNLYWRNKALAKEIDKAVDKGLVGATEDMPVFKASDMYNPEHFRAAVRYNPKQIDAKQYVSSKKHQPSSTDVEQVLNTPQLESKRILALPQEEYTVPEASYTGRVPTRSYNLRDLLQGTGSNIIQSSGEVLNPTTPEQRPVVPQKLLPLNKRSEYVDSEGNVNMRNVVKAVRKFYKNHPEARNYKEIMNWRDVPGVGQQQRNLYLHISDVVKSAQQAPVPEGFTRLNLVQAALFHDIGKVLNPDKSHGETSVDILKELGIHASYDVKHAIKRHMSHHLGDEDPLTKALHFVDVVRDTQPMSNTGAYDTFRNLLYPSNLPYKIRPLYSWDYDWLLNNIINPILREYGYDEIPLGLSKEETRKLVLDRALEHRTFARGLHAFNSDNLKNATNQFIRREGRYPTEEELFDQGFEYYKEHGTTSGDRGAKEYMSKFELPYKKFMSLYTSNSDEVYRGYLRGTDADYAARALQLPVQDNPNWSLAELWGYNDYPLVYSPGGDRTPVWSSNWRFQRLPSILNFGNSATPSVLTLEEADIINARNRSQAANIAHEKARLEVVAGIDNGNYKNAPKYYQTKPSYFMEASSKPDEITDVPSLSSIYDYIRPDAKTFKEPTLGEYYGTNIIGSRNQPFPGNRRKTLSEAVSGLNDYLREHGVKEVMPYAYSLLKPRKKDLIYSPGNPNPINAEGYRNTVIKYPVALNNLLNQIEYIKLQLGDIPAHIPVILDRVTKKPKPAAYQYRGMSVKQIEAHNNANKPRVNKDGIVVNTPLFITDYLDPYGGYFVASNTKYVPDISKMIKDAVDQYYKDVKLARSKDAFIRRKIHQDDLDMFIASESNKLFDKYYVKPELVKPDKLAPSVGYPFTTQSFDGYRVFVTEHKYGPGSGYLNNYILVGPRGAKAATIDRNFKLDIDNHGYTRGYDNIGRPVKGLTKNAM